MGGIARISHRMTTTTASSPRGSFALQGFALALLAAAAAFHAFTVVSSLRRSTRYSNHDDQHHRQPSSSSSGALATLPLPRCRILIQNSVPWHYEVLESMMHLPLEMYSLEEDANKSCNPNKLIFDFALASDEQWDHFEERRKDWEHYFQTKIKSKYGDGTERIIAGQIIVPFDRNTTDPMYSAIVEASCYCDETYFNWIDSYSKRRCMLHRTCNETAHNNKYWSSSPFNPRHFFPNILPSVAESSSRSGKSSFTLSKTQSAPYELCVIGKSNKRNFGFLYAFFKAGGKYSDAVQVQLHGRGGFPWELKRYKDRITQSSSNGFLEFQGQIAKCDAILTLLDTKGNDQYFSTTLTGSLPQASAYNIPLVLHQELARVYRNVLPDVFETHGDDNESFVVALNQLLERLRAARSSQNKKS